MRGLKQMIREEAERKARKAERERIKKEKLEQKEKEKKERKKLAHKKRLKSKQNKRAYAKRRKVILDQKNKEGDEYGYYMILLMKDKCKVKRLTFRKWRNNVMKAFDDIVAKNRSEVSFPKQFIKSLDKNHQIKTEYEVVIVELLKDGEDNTTRLRNEYGKFIDHVIVDNKNYALIRKEDWWEEEYFSVYGYDPQTEKKTFKFIMDNIILKNVDRDNMKRIFVHNQRVYIQYDSDFDFITCRNDYDAKRLYDAILKQCGNNKYIFFTGELPKEQVTWLYNQIEEKTGWNRNAIILNKGKILN